MLSVGTVPFQEELFSGQDCDAPKDTLDLGSCDLTCQVYLDKCHLFTPLLSQSRRLDTEELSLPDISAEIAEIRNQNGSLEQWKSKCSAAWLSRGSPRGS